MPKKDVSLAEIEQALSVVRRVVDDPFPGERRYRTVGRPGLAGYVFAVFTLRASRLRPISVRYMHEREVASYEEGLAELAER